MITALRKAEALLSRLKKSKSWQDQPLRNIMHNPKSSGRLIKWAIELGEFDIKYKATNGY